MSQIKPLVDRIIVSRFEEEEVIKNGLFIPDNAREKPYRGLVVEVGSGKIVNGVLVPLDVEVGDTVVFGKYSGAEIEIDGVLLLVLREEDIYGKIV
jgi:chaperonin GroES